MGVGNGRKKQRCGVDRKSVWLVALALAFSFGVLSWVATEAWKPGARSLGSAQRVDARRAPLPDFASLADTTDRKIAFFEFVKRLINAENAAILAKRATVREGLLLLRNGEPLTDQLAHTIQAWLDAYNVEDSVTEVATLQRLLKRMDVIPPSLAMAQAANESAWGTSRFAREGNNLFGQWCFRLGCGIAPALRPEGETYEVRVFKKPYQSVVSYVHNLNTHRTYARLRNLRLAARDAGQPLTGLRLIDGLRGYSQEGPKYVEWIRQIIITNNLTLADQHLGE